MKPWICAGGRDVCARESFGLMGICNLTPDSFYDGGRHDGRQEALDHCRDLIRQGADIIDFGAESTRPGSTQVTPDMEIKRLMPILQEARSEFPEALISVDTRNSRTAEAALAAGCDIINDVSACSHDDRLLEVLAEYKPGYVLMHDGRQIQGSGHGDLVLQVSVFFEHLLKRLVQLGLPEDHIVLDPGIGFGKTTEQNLLLLAHIADFQSFGRPLLCGVSMKSLFADLLDLPVSDRGEATAVVAALLYAKGVVWHRVHQPLAVAKALRLAQALNA